ncbi:unnamed protein product [Echinostoma caproni]|uniref:CUB domain-containing protein n=1 Tax=Echinostoma caproni TaxID=27848 RepID=A0A183AK64_9TREM|nr:unnamed protein product [Echinostoma caproni]
MTVAPIRCLFKELEIHTDVDSDENLRPCNQEAIQACQRSVERFRQRYNFDLVRMSPLKPCDCWDKENGNGTKPEFGSRRCVSCGSFNDWTDGDTTCGMWNWTSVCVEQEYVPQFYHSVRSCSESCLKSVPTKTDSRPDIPQTPTKPQCSRTSSIKSTSKTSVFSLEQEQSKTNPAKLTTPSVVHLWCARIRRRSTYTNESDIQKKNKSIGHSVGQDDTCPTSSYVPVCPSDAAPTHGDSSSCQVETKRKNPDQIEVTKSHPTLSEGFTRWPSGGTVRQIKLPGKFKIHITNFCSTRTDGFKIVFLTGSNTFDRSAKWYYS